MKPFFDFAKMMCVGIFLFLAFGAQALDVLLVAYDMGDLNPIRRVASQLKGDSYQIVAFGKAGEVCEKEKIPHAMVISGDFSKRETLFDDQQIKQILTQNPTVILTGMASAAQAQVLNTSGLDAAHQFALYDNLDPIKDKEYVKAFFQKIRPESVTYLVPARFLKEEFEKFRINGDQRIAIPDRIITVGQPMLEAWMEVRDATDAADVRTQLGIDPKSKVVLWATDTVDGHGDYLRVFGEAMKQNPNWTGLVTLHPKYTQSEIQAILDPIAAPNITIVPKDGPSTNQIAAIASLFAVHQSSVGPQAFSAGVPVIYVAPKSYANFMMEKGLANRFDTAEEVSGFLQTFKPADSAQHLQKMSDAGIPMNGTQNIVNVLTQAAMPKK